jgi:hypothetical protein
VSACERVLRRCSVTKDRGDGRLSREGTGYRKLLVVLRFSKHMANDVADRLSSAAREMTSTVGTSSSMP